jgi:hypothetical protein
VSYMYAGYAVAIGVLGLYALRLSVRRRRLERLVSSRLKRLAGPGPEAWAEDGRQER